ncbi:MAG TPA: hypothetical protein VNG13_15815 [Mycobacteriales bacterium]|nr:hypothetical protein [Mycobacteriales bacterium]
MPAVPWLWFELELALDVEEVELVDVEEVAPELALESAWLGSALPTPWSLEWPLLCAAADELWLESANAGLPNSPTAGRASARADTSVSARAGRDRDIGNSVRVGADVRVVVAASSRSRHWFPGRSWRP